MLTLCIQGVHTSVYPVLCGHLWFQRAVNAMRHSLCLQSTTPASVRVCQINAILALKNSKLAVMLTRMQLKSVPYPYTLP